jgi:hypothetical protein
MFVFQCWLSSFDTFVNFGLVPLAKVQNLSKIPPLVAEKIILKLVDLIFKVGGWLAGWVAD